MRISTAYFAGVGTVIVAVGVGLGGGYLAANIANTPPAVSKLERRMSGEPISVAAGPEQPRAVATSPVPAQVPQTRAASPSDIAAPSTGNAAAFTDTIKSEDGSSNNVAAVQSAPPAPQPARSLETKVAEPAAEKAAIPRDAFAKARDADIKRAEAERRRTERRQATMERRRVQPPSEQELDAVEERVREVTEPRRIRIREEYEPREMFVEPARALPRIRLFDRD